MIVEINPKKKLKNGDILIYKDGVLEPFNLEEFIHNNKEKLATIEEQMNICNNTTINGKTIIEGFNGRIGDLESGLSKLENVLENIIRGFITK